MLALALVSAACDSKNTDSQGMNETTGSSSASSSESVDCDLLRPDSEDVCEDSGCYAASGLVLQQQDGVCSQTPITLCFEAVGGASSPAASYNTVTGEVVEFSFTLSQDDWVPCACPSEAEEGQPVACECAEQFELNPCE